MTGGKIQIFDEVQPTPEAAQSYGLSEKAVGVVTEALDGDRLRVDFGANGGETVMRASDLRRKAVG